RACAPGVGVVSRFFTGDGPVEPYGDGWASWSGTSFAAPIVAGVLARAVAADGLSPAQAVARHGDDPGLVRLPGHGTVVNAHEDGSGPVRRPAASFASRREVPLAWLLGPATDPSSSAATAESSREVRSCPPSSSWSARAARTSPRRGRRPP